MTQCNFIDGIESLLGVESRQAVAGHTGEGINVPEKTLRCIHLFLGGVIAYIQLFSKCKLLNCATRIPSRHPIQSALKNEAELVVSLDLRLFDTSLIDLILRVVLEMGL